MTKLQEQIVFGIAKGLPFKCIADELEVSPSTVGYIAWRLQDKFQVKKSKHLPGEVEYLSWST